MKCKKVKNHLINYLEGTIPAEKKELLDNHIKDCKKCRILIQEFSGLWEMTAMPVTENVSPFIPDNNKWRR